MSIKNIVVKHGTKTIRIKQVVQVITIAEQEVAVQLATPVYPVPVPRAKKKIAPVVSLPVTQRRAYQKEHANARVVSGVLGFFCFSFNILNSDSMF